MTPLDTLLVCGFDGLAVRTALNLQACGYGVILIAPDEGLHVREAKAAGIIFVPGDYEDVLVLERAGIASCKAVILAHESDSANLQCALTILDTWPTFRIVIRSFNEEFGAHVDRLIPSATCLSSSALAAPAFADALIESSSTIEVAGRRLEVRVGDVASSDVATPLVIDVGSATASQRSQPDLWQLYQIRAALGGNVRKLALGVLGIALLSTWVFGGFYSLSWLDAAYFTVTVMTTTGFGDIALKDAPEGVKVFGMVLMIVGAASVALLYAFLTESLVRLSTPTVVDLRSALKGHVLVCGLGRVGYRVARILALAGRRVVAVDPDITTGFAQLARSYGVRVLQGDASTVHTLELLGLAKARGVMALTDDDMLNLEIALSVKTSAPNVDVVVRLYDEGLAARVRTRFGVKSTLSVSSLAAPAFAVSALGFPAHAVCLVQDQIYVLTRLCLSRPTHTSAFKNYGLLVVCATRATENDTVWAPTGALDVGDTLFLLGTLPTYVVACAKL